MGKWGRGFQAAKANTFLCYLLHANWENNSIASILCSWYFIIDLRVVISYLNSSSFQKS